MSLISKTVTSADGTKIYAEALGDPSCKSHFIFLHGLCANTIVFDCLFNHPKMTKDFYMVRYDWRGHGQSDKPNKPEAYLSKAFAEDWHAVAKAFDLVQPIHVGWSLGAAVATDVLTYLPPKTISGYVNFCGIPYHGDIMTQAMTPTLASWADGLCSSDASTALAIRRSLGKELVYIWDTLPFATQLQYFGSASVVDPEVAKCVISRTSDPKALYAAGKRSSSSLSSLPCLFIHGAQDTVIQTHAVASELKREFEDYTEVYLEECKHAVFLDQREKVVDALVRFAGKVREGGRL